MANDILNTKLAPLMEQLLEEAINGLLERLQQKNCEECGARTAAPADFSNVLKMLKDNGFTVDPLKAGDALDDIINNINKTAQGYPQVQQKPS